jgi:hypothetical protein
MRGRIHGGRTVARAVAGAARHPLRVHVVSVLPCRRRDGVAVAAHQRRRRRCRGEGRRNGFDLRLCESRKRTHLTLTGNRSLDLCARPPYHGARVKRFMAPDAILSIERRAVGNGRKRWC